MTDSKHKRALNRIMWRGRIKTLLQLGGIIPLSVGVMFLPWRGDHGHKTTIFDRIVSFGTFSRPAVLLIAFGAIALTVSWLIRGNLYEEP